MSDGVDGLEVPFKRDHYKTDLFSGHTKDSLQSKHSNTLPTYFQTEHSFNLKTTNVYYRALCNKSERFPGHTKDRLRFKPVQSS